MDPFHLRVASYTWQDIQDKASGVSITCLKRTPYVQRQYDANRELVASMFARYSDFIKIHVLHWEPAKNDDGLIEARPTRNSIKTPLLTPNSYPYNVEAGISHMVLWSVEPPLTEEDMHASIRSQAGPDMDYIAFVNRVEHRSIMDLWHAQVFLWDRAPIRRTPLIGS